MAEEKTNMIGIEQGRAEFAFNCAKEGSTIEKKDEYKSYVKKVPMLIKTNGLGAALGFMLSKHGTYEKIGEQLLKWLKMDNKSIVNLGSVNTFNELTKEIVKMNSIEYRAITNEVLAFLTWLKRFADGLITKKEVE